MKIQGTTQFNMPKKSTLKQEAKAETPAMPTDSVDIAFGTKEKILPKVLMKSAEYTVASLPGVGAAWGGLGYVATSMHGRGRGGKMMLAGAASNLTGTALGAIGFVIGMDSLKYAGAGLCLAGGIAINKALESLA